MRVTLTIKNYRCFVQPATIEIGKGFTSFVGVNNAGKSTIMRFLLEFRPIFQVIGETGNFVNALRSSAGFEPLHVLDKEEIFSNLNENPIEFWFNFYELPEHGLRQPSKILFQVSRNLSWRAHIFFGDNQQTYAGRGIEFTNNVLKLDGTPTANLEPFFEMTKSLGNNIYIGPFRNTINVGTKDNYLDIKIGQSFIKEFRSLKTGKDKRKNTAMTKLQNDIRKIFEFDSFNIEPSEDDESLHITINEKPYKQHELGSGLLQFILVFANVLVAQPSYVLIDEPELNLHPSLQLDFLTTLGSYAKDGIWFSSHSIGLARTTSERVYSVIKEGDGDSIVRQISDTPRLTEFLGEMSFSSHKELGFEKILLVEGPTEVKTIQQFLRKMTKDHKILLLPLHGRITKDMAEELSEVLRITKDIAVLIDSERLAAGADMSHERQSFIDLCKKKKIPAHALELRAIENYFSDEAVKTVFGSKYRGLQPYEKLGDVEPHWGKHQNYKLANATSLDEISKTDLGKFLAKL